MKGSALVELMAPITLAYYARLCGWTLAGRLEAVEGV
jgi:hypothetical protein